MTEETPVIGDGKSTIPIPFEEREEMPDPIDLAPNVAAQLQTETVGNIQQNNALNRNVAGVAMGVLQSAAARNFDELGTLESRANSGVLATPIAGPTTQAGP